MDAGTGAHRTAASAYRIVTLRWSATWPRIDTLSLSLSVFALASRRAVDRLGFSRSDSSVPAVQVRRRAATVRRLSLSRLAAVRVTASAARPLPLAAHETVTLMPRARKARTDDGSASSPSPPRATWLPWIPAGATTTTCTVAEPVAPSGR